MFEKDTIRGFITGVMTYFVLQLTLDLLGINSTIVEIISISTIALMYHMIDSQEKKI